MDGKTLHERLGKGMFPSEDRPEMARPEYRVARLFQGACTDAGLRRSQGTQHCNARKMLWGDCLFFSHFLIKTWLWIKRTSHAVGLDP